MIDIDEKPTLFLWVWGDFLSNEMTERYIVETWLTKRRFVHSFLVPTTKKKIPSLWMPIFSVFSSIQARELYHSHSPLAKMSPWFEWSCFSQWTLLSDSSEKIRNQIDLFKMWKNRLLPQRVPANPRYFVVIQSQFRQGHMLQRWGTNLQVEDTKYCMLKYLLILNIKNVTWHDLNLVRLLSMRKHGCGMPWSMVVPVGSFWIR